MNRQQRILLAVFTTLTILILILDQLFPGRTPVYYVKYGTILSLALTAALLRKRHQVQYLMCTAVLFAAIADFFLVFSNTVPTLQGRVYPFGMAGFLIAYFLLIIAFQKNFSVGRGEILAIMPVLVISLPVFVILYPHVNGAMFAATLVFLIVVCYMAWTALSTVFRGYFSPQAARLLTLAGLLMLICDMGVAINQYHPAYAGHFVPWLKNIIWAAYIPGWTLLVVAIAEEQLLVSSE